MLSWAAVWDTSSGKLWTKRWRKNMGIVEIIDKKTRRWKTQKTRTMEDSNKRWYQLKMDNMVAYDEWLYDWFNNANDAIDFGNLDYEELDEGEDMDDSEE